jgi:hypothetical protein
MDHFGTLDRAARRPAARNLRRNRDLTAVAAATDHDLHAAARVGKGTDLKETMPQDRRWADRIDVSVKLADGIAPNITRKIGQSITCACFTLPPLPAFGPRISSNNSSIGKDVSIISFQSLL